VDGQKNKLIIRLITEDALEITFRIVTWCVL